MLKNIHAISRPENTFAKKLLLIASLSPTWWPESRNRTVTVQVSSRPQSSTICLALQRIELN